jgi:LuxR family transcriptional regulator, quorum-sensing system regulator CviR
MYGSKEGISISAFAPSEFKLHLSGNDAITLLEFIHKSLSCNSKKDFIALYPKLQEMLSFDYANAILGYYDNKTVIVSDYGINVSMPKGWVSEYMTRNYLQKDAIVRENFMSYKVQYWSDSKKKLDYSPEINSLCNDFGMREGYTHGSRLLATGKYGSKFCFSSPSMKYDKRTIAILDLVTPHLHLALSHLYGNKQPDSKSINLTIREKEVLNWMKQGKTSWDISVILRISERTVNFHVYNIMEKLEVTNRPQAVAVANRLGLIDFN